MGRPSQCISGATPGATGRSGMPVDIGGATVFPALAGTSYITGQMLYIAGGLLTNETSWEVRT